MRWLLPFRFVACLTLLLFGLCAQSADNLCFNGDFEQPSAESPPPGWAMWGAQIYKIPAYYTRDTTYPHSGKACLRIYHPANTAGYIVSHPDHALQAEEGKMISVRFWARTDKPGPSVFMFTAYESLRPFRDAPSPGRYVIDVDTQWREFSFTVYEGWDYFAARSKYILLTFIPTTDMSLEKTLWIDDVVLTQEPSPRQGRLIDESSLQYEPLQHRLQPGERLEFSVDAARPWRPAVREVGGLSFHRVCGWTGQPYNKQGEYTLDPRVEQAIAALQLPMTRFYAVGDEPFGVEGALDRIAILLKRIGVPEEKCVLELETQSAATKLAPEIWAQAARYCLAKGYRFRYWEIANEPFWAGGGQRAFPTPDDYVAHVRACATAIRNVQPEAQIGLAIADSLPWGNYLLKQAAGAYDFVVGHYYAAFNVHRRKFEAIALTDNYRVLDRILRVNALMRAYNPGREVYQLDTEWGSHSSGPNGERADYVDRNANIFGVLHRAVRLIYYAREGMLRGASAWQLLNRLGAQGFAILSQEAPDKRFMLYWLYYYFNRYVGEQALEPVGVAPYYAPTAEDDPTIPPGAYPGPLTPVLVTMSADRRTLFVMIANGSWNKSVPCQMRWQNFAAAQAEAVILSSDDPEAKPLLEDEAAFVRKIALPVAPDGLAYDVPPHSVTFLRIASR